MSEHVSHDQWWQFPEDDDSTWLDTGPDLPPVSLSGAMSDPISRYAVSAPRIPRQRTGGNQPLRVPTLPAEVTELAFTQLIPAQYRPTELRVTHASLDDLSVLRAGETPEAPTDTTAHPSLRHRGPAAVARAAARALRGVRRAA